MKVPFLCRCRLLHSFWPSSSSPTSTTTCHHSRAHFCLQVLPPKTMREIVHVQAGQCGNQVRKKKRRRALRKQGHSAIEWNTKFCTFTDLLRSLACFENDSWPAKKACPECWPCPAGVATNYSTAAHSLPLLRPCCSRQAQCQSCASSALAKRSSAL